MDKNELLDSICCSINKVKKTSYVVSSIKDELYLGGDFAIDSIEMLEVWFNLEKKVGIVIPDADKRDVYTIGQLVGVVMENV